VNTPSELEVIIRQVGGDPADLPFWQGCREGRLMLHRCEICQRSYWPASRCIDHGDTAMGWVAGSGRGSLYTYTVLHHAYTSSMKDKLPYVVAVIKLEEGPFFHSNVVDCPLEEVRIGMPLRAEMVEHESGLVVPVFRRLSSISE
jgi:uncharacterized OB-fold protein